MVNFDTVAFWAFVVGFICVGVAVTWREGHEGGLEADYQRGFAHGVGFMGLCLMVGAVLGLLVVHVRFV